MVEHATEAGPGIPVAAGEGAEISAPAPGQAEHEGRSIIRAKKVETQRFMRR
jgi:hypothetical protein